jgi:hypothetical protein
MNIPAAHPIQFVGASGASVTCQHGVNMRCEDDPRSPLIGSYEYNNYDSSINDGQCEDGGPGALFRNNAAYPLGMDCTDCGGRCCNNGDCTAGSTSDTTCTCYGASESQVVSGGCTVAVTLLAGGAQPYGNDYYTGAIRVAFSSQCAGTDVQINCYNHGAMSSFLRHDDTCTNAVLSPSPPPPSYDYRDSNLHTYTNCLSLPLYPFI